MRIPSAHRSGSVSINMTPMIDVTFLLIIFFLVSSHLGKQENHLKLELPFSQTGIDPGLTDPRSLTTVHVLPDGSLHLGARAVSLEQFANAIRERHRETPGGLRLRIRTDRQVPYSAIARVLKTCARVGIGDVVFAVYEEKPPRG